MGRSVAEAGVEVGVLAELFVIVVAVVLVGGLLTVVRELVGGVLAAVGHLVA